MRKLLQNSFVRNVSILTGGTVFAQGLTVLALPVLTRLYSPDDFSTLAVYMALVGILSTIGCLRYNIAIPLPEEDADGMSLLALSVLAASLFSLVTGLVLIGLSGDLSALMGTPDLAPFMWMVPFSVWAASLYTAFQYWTSRKKRFGLITRTRLTRSTGGVVTQLGLGLAGTGGFGLLFGQTLNNSLGVFGLVRATLREDRGIWQRVSQGRTGRTARRYWRFPVWSVPEALFNSAGVQLPIILISGAVAGAEAGFVLLAMRVMGLPMGLVGSSVAQVYLAEAGQRHQAGTLARFTNRTMWTLAKLGGLPLLAVGLLSPFAFPWVFGQEWARAGVIVAWMTPWFILQFVASPISMVLHVLGHLRTAMWLQLSGFLLRAGAVFLAIGYRPDWIVEVYALSGAVFYGVYMILIDRLVRK